MEVKASTPTQAFCLHDATKAAEEKGDMMGLPVNSEPAGTELYVGSCCLPGTAGWPRHSCIIAQALMQHGPGTHAACCPSTQGTSHRGIDQEVMELQETEGNGT